MGVGAGPTQREHRAQITFWPEGERVRVPLETTLLEAAKIAGVDLASSCGGDGLCGKCRVIVRQGNVTAQPTSLLSREEIRRDYVLACQTQVAGDVEIEIPPESRDEATQILIDIDAQRYRALCPVIGPLEVRPAPLTRKLFLEPGLEAHNVPQVIPDSPGHHKEWDDAEISAGRVSESGA